MAEDITGMDAELCRLLARALSSPYRRYAELTIAMEAGDTPVRDYLIAQGIKAYTFAELPSLLREFLRLCSVSQDIHTELFGGEPTGLSVAEEDAQVIDEMVQRGELEDEED